jgi:SH3-like domain-containing protein
MSLAKVKLYYSFKMTLCVPLMPHSWGIDHPFVSPRCGGRSNRRLYPWTTVTVGVLCMGLSGCWPSSPQSQSPAEKTLPQAQRWLTPQPKVDVAVLKQKVNWRSGPGADHGVLWSYESPGWPVQILKRFNNWYWVQDMRKTQGWVKGSMLSFTPGGVILKRTYLRSSPGGAKKAVLLQGVLVSYKTVNQDWIYVTISKHQNLKGWISKDDVWPTPPRS